MITSSRNSYSKYFSLKLFSRLFLSALMSFSSIQISWAQKVRKEQVTVVPAEQADRDGLKAQQAAAANPPVKAPAADSGMENLDYSVSSSPTKSSPGNFSGKFSLTAEKERFDKVVVKVRNNGQNVDKEIENIQNRKQQVWDQWVAYEEYQTCQAADCPPAGPQPAEPKPKMEPALNDKYNALRMRVKECMNPDMKEGEKQEHGSGVFQGEIKACYTNYEMAMNEAESTLGQIMSDETSRKKGMVSAVSTSYKAKGTFNDMNRSVASHRASCVAGMKSGGLCSERCSLKGIDPSDTQEAWDLANQHLVAGSKAGPGVFKICQNEYKTIIDKYDAAMNSAAQLAGESTKAWRTFRNVAIGTAVVGASIATAVILVNKSKDKKKEKKEAEERANAIVSIDGNKVDCKTSSTYTKPECKVPLQTYCASEANEVKGGCQAFLTHACSGNDANSSYCVYNSSKNYCKVGGAAVKDSPSCLFVSTRPASCNSTPDSLNCLSGFSAATLNEKCGTYQTDPICQRHASGSLLAQPDSSLVSRGTTTTGSAKITRSMSSIVGAEETSKVATTNMWRANSAALQKLCTDGQMVGCAKK